MVRNRVVLALMACLASFAAALSPIERYGPLRIVGNKLCDSAGKPVTLRGMSLGYHNLMGSKGYWNESAIRWVQSDWSVSVIRAQVYAGADLHWESTTGYVYKGYASDSATALDFARRAIDAAIKAGVYVVVDFDFAGGSSSIPAAQSFFGTLGTEYGSYPNVIWEIWGGPGGGITPTQISDYARSVVPVVRRNSPDNLILFPSESWGTRPPQNDVLRSAGFGNYAYAMSFQAGETGHRVSVLNDSVPLFASEWGTAGSSGDGVLADSASKAWLHVTDSLGISGCNWGLFDLSKEGTTTSLITASALRHGVKLTGSWAAEDLTPSGTLVRGYLRGANPAWTFPDSAVSVAADRDTAVLKKDSVTIRAVARWPQGWKISLKGRTSGKTMSYASPASVRVFEVRWRAGYTGVIGSMSAGEWVDITTTPAGGRDSVYMAPPSTQVRGESWTVRWSGDGRRLVLPEGFGAPGDRVLVRTMHVDGHVESEYWATISEDGLLACGEELRAASIRLLELRNGSRSLRRLLPPIARY